MSSSGLTRGSSLVSPLPSPPHRWEGTQIQEGRFYNFLQGQAASLLSTITTQAPWAVDLLGHADTLGSAMLDHLGQMVFGMGSTKTVEDSRQGPVKRILLGDEGSTVLEGPSACVESTVSYSDIATFLQETYGIESPLAFNIFDVDGFAGLLTRLGTAGESLLDNFRLIVLMQRSLWVERCIHDLARAIYSLEAMRYMGFCVPDIQFHINQGSLVCLQELFLGFLPPMLGDELESVASTALPCVLASQGNYLELLNLTLNKFLTCGRERYYVGMRSRNRAADLGFIVWELRRAGFLDPKQGIDQFAAGLQKVSLLDDLQFVTYVGRLLEEAGFPVQGISEFLEFQHEYRESFLTSDVIDLCTVAQYVEPQIAESLDFLRRFMISKQELLPDQIRSHMHRPERIDLIQKAEVIINRMIESATEISFDDHVAQMLSDDVRVIRITGATARGKSTFMPVLVSELEAKGRRVIPISLDGIGLRHRNEREPIKSMILRGAGMGFESYSDTELCFDQEKVERFFDDLVLGLDSNNPSPFILRTMERTWQQDGNKVVAKYEIIERE